MKTTNVQKFAKIVISAITALLFLSLNSALYPQAPDFLWVRQAGGTSDDSGFDIAIDNLNNSIVTGSFLGTVTFGATTLTSAGLSDIFVVKYDPNGNVLWAKQAGGVAQHDFGEAVATDKSGNGIVTGFFGGTAIFGMTALRSVGGWDIFVSKYDANGSLLWVKQAGGAIQDQGLDIATDALGNSFITGTFDGTASFGTFTLISAGGQGDIFNAKFDPNGNVIWAKRAGGVEYDVGQGIATDGSGNSIVTGYFRGRATFGTTTLISAGLWDIFIAKYDANGNLVWVKQAGGTGYEEGTSIATDGSNNIIVTGGFQGTVTFGTTILTSSGLMEMFIVKYDANGNILWAKQAGGVGEAEGQGIATDGFGNSIVTGYFSGTAAVGTIKLASTGERDIFIVKYNKNGDVIWAKQAGGAGYDYGRAIATEAAASSMVIGTFQYTSSFDATMLTSIGASDIFIAKLNPDYLLKKQLTDGSYEIFQVDKHAWQFGNTVDNMWPFWHLTCFGEDVIRCKKRRRCEDVFPSWDLFANVFGANQVYFDQNGKQIRKPSAVEKWDKIKSCWDGSCFGFAVSSFLAFDNKTAFLQAFPNISDFNNLHELMLNKERREVINQLWIYQFGKTQQDHTNANKNKMPNQTLSELKQMLLGEKRDDRFLAFLNQNGSGGHVLNPYKIERDQSNPNLEYIYVYDSNIPTRSDLKVAINTTTNTWDYPSPSTQNWGGSRGFFLMDPVSNYLSKPVLPKSIPPREGWFSKAFNATEYVEFYNSLVASIVIINQQGKTIGYRDSVAFNNFEDGVPIIPITGSFHPPIGYFIPNGQYSIRIQNFADSSAYFSILTDSLIYSYNRIDADSTQTDNLTYRNGLAIKNHDNQIKTAKLEIILIGVDNEKVFEVQKCALSQNDSLRFDVANRRDMNIFNFGSEKNYALKIRSVSTKNDIIFEHRNIKLSSTASQIISPNWDNLANQPVLIFIDENLDGMIDDTLKVDNQFTSVKDFNQGLEIPTDYFLEQNYPNPFNPVTQIRFGLPKPSEVKIEAYNSFGQRVAVILNSKRLAGYHVVQFDGSGLASGIYFCRLQADKFIQVRKMILLR